MACVRAVVLLQLHDFHVLIVVLELQDVLHRGAAERIDALRIVAHHADVLVHRAQHLDDGILRRCWYPGTHLSGCT